VHPWYTQAETKDLLEAVDPRATLQEVVDLGDILVEAAVELEAKELEVIQVEVVDLQATRGAVDPEATLQEVEDLEATQGAVELEATQGAMELEATQVEAVDLAATLQEVVDMEEAKDLQATQDMVAVPQEMEDQALVHQVVMVATNLQQEMVAMDQQVQGAMDLVDLMVDTAQECSVPPMTLLVATDHQHLEAMVPMQGPTPALLATITQAEMSTTE
jgi:hypothetical protein